MKGLSLPSAALALMLSTPVASHDTGLDGLYVETDDDAHVCHHMQVQFWSEMIERATAEIWQLRYDHARPKQPNAKLSEGVRELAQVHRRGLETKRNGFAVLSDRAKLYGCDPWPPSGGNER